MVDDKSKSTVTIDFLLQFRDLLNYCCQTHICIVIRIFIYLGCGGDTPGTRILATRT